MKRKFLSLKTSEMIALFVSIIYILGIVICASFLSSCATSYPGMGYKVAPIVSDYNVKDIKSQTSSNVFPWEEVAM